MHDRDTLIAATTRYHEVLGQDLPAASEAVLAEAERAVAGEIHFQGGEYVHIGRANIDFTGKHVAHHVWKERPKRYLYFPPLMAAYAATADERFAEAARDYIADFIRAFPNRPDWTMAAYDNGLNLGVRLPIWAEALSVFAPSPAWDDAFCETVTESIACQLHFIGANLSPKGNFRMKQAMTLMEVGLRLPYRPEAPAWRQQGAAVMNDAARRQVLPDGAHVECTAGYHTWMTRLFADCLTLQRAYPDLGLSMTVGMVAKMYDYSLASTRPNGTTCGINDIEGDWEGEHPNTYAKWRKEFRAAAGLPDTMPPTSQVYPDARQAFLRDGWGHDATYLTMESTRWGGAHCHLARNGMQLHAFGRTLLMDPGRISYEMSDPLATYAKSTRAHNTLNLNGWNQFTTNADDFRSFTAPGHDCVSSRYTGGYWKGPFGWWFFNGLGHGIAATHSRHMLWVHGRFAVVIDEIVRWKEEGCGPDHEQPTLEANWQLSPSTVQVDAARRQAWTCNTDANLLIHVAEAPANAAIEVHAGELDPPRGWVRNNIGTGGVAAPQVSVVCRPWEGYVDTLVTLLVPFQGEARPQLETAVSIGNANKGGRSELVVTWADGTRETVRWILGLETMLGACPEGDTDGVLLYHRAPGNTDAAGPAALAGVDATYVHTTATDVADAATTVTAALRPPPRN